MKAKSILALLLLCLPFGLAAQDLVVTQADDSIHCRISGIYGDLIEFSHLRNGKRVRMQLALAAVKSYRFNYFYDPSEEKQRPPQWSIGLGVGCAYRPLAVYNLGAYIDVDLTKFIEKKRTHGIGVKYALCLTGGGQSFYTPSHNPQSPGGYYSHYSRVVNIRLIGIFGSYRLKGDRHCLIFRYGLGPMFYREDTYYYRGGSGEDEYSNGTAFGVFGDIGYSFRITKHLSLGLKSGFAGGMVTSLEGSEFSRKELSKDQRIILDYLKLGLDIRFDI